MKTLAMILLLSVVAVLALEGSPVTATATLHIEGMTCVGCATSVKLVLLKTSGVVSADVSYEKKQAVVTYDPDKTSPLQIAKAVSKELDYEVAVRAQDLTEAELRSTEAEVRWGGIESCAHPEGHPPANAPIKLEAFAVEKLRAEFNKASDRIRVVALLSPTCPACQHGQGVVKDVFGKFPHEQRMRGFIVWLPMLRTDDERAAGRYAAAFTDDRVSQVWDRQRASGQMLAKTLGLNRTAWDVYLLYAPGVKWTAEAPPTPTFWMHQLRADSGADQKICLNPAVFTAKVAELLRRGEKATGYGDRGDRKR